MEGKGEASVGLAGQAGASVLLTAQHAAGPCLVPHFCFGEGHGRGGSCWP